MGRKTGNPVGRPKATKLSRGRPKGQEAIMKDYRMRMLKSPKSPKVLQTIMDVAQDPEHKHWAAASKMVLDRIAPLTGFNPDQKSDGKIQINITTHGDTSITGGDDAIDGEFTEADS